MTSQPLNSDVNTPMAANAKVLRPTHCTIAGVPDVHSNGIAGKMAPTANNRNENPAAVHGLPPSSMTASVNTHNPSVSWNRRSISWTDEYTRRSRPPGS